jgi:hypothetical protein
VTKIRRAPVVSKCPYAAGAEDLVNGNSLLIDDRAGVLRFAPAIEVMQHKMPTDYIPVAWITRVQQQSARGAARW